MREFAVGTTFADHLIRGVVGRGGMGVVYRALHVPLRREVALKVISPESARDDEYRERFRRELEAAAAIEHRNVVPVYHAGEEAGHLFVTMRLVEGSDLGRLLALEGRLEPRRAVELIAQIAGALDAAHARSMVHRDVKPANILIDGNEALLTDFGLMKDLSATQITTAGQQLGTFAYMAPEQIEGFAVDARTDVYALGCVLYQALTGEVPFPRDTVAATMFAHLSAPPPADAPAGLDVVIQCAMAKASAQRYDSAGALADAALAIVGGNGGPTERAVAPRSVPTTLPPAVRGELGSGAFVGRAAALEELETRYQLAAAGERQFVLVSGEAGIGKTRLVSELAARAHGRRATVLYGRSDPESLIPYQPFITAVQHYIAHRDTLVFPPELAPELQELARFVPALRPQLQSVREPLAEDPQTRRWRLFEAVTRVLAFIARSAPALLILDDLQWADPATAGVLGHLWSDGEPIRLLVIATFREPGETPCTELTELLARLSRDAGFTRVTLTGLERDEVAKLVEAHGASPELITDLRARTEGNPFFMVETLRGLDSGMTVPDGVAQLIAQRLAKLTDTAGEALKFGAVVGREFRLATLEELVDAPADAVLAGLEEAVAAGLLREVEEDIDRFAFSHALVREALYAQLGGARRSRAHRRVGEVLERLGADPAELAHHFLEGRAYEQAIGYCALAGERAMAALAYEEAAGHYQRALDVLEGDEPLRCALLLGLGEAQQRAGHEQAAATFMAAAEIARREGLADEFARAALGPISNVETTMLEPPALENIEAALDMLGDADHPLVVKLLAMLSNSLHFAGDRERTEELSRRALEMARRLDDPSALAVALQSRHIASGDVDQLAERLALGEELLSVARAGGDRELEAVGLFSHIYDLSESGDLETARRYHQRLLDLAAELGQPMQKHLAAVWSATFAPTMPEAERLALEAFQHGEAAHVRGAAMFYGAHILSIRDREDRLAEVIPMIEFGIEQSGEFALLHTSLVRAHLRAGNRELAAAKWEGLAQAGFDTLAPNYLRLSMLCSLAEAAALIGDADRAASLYALLLPYRALNLQTGMMCCFGSVERYLALAAAASGDVENAVAHFEAAIAANDARGLDVAAATARIELAELFVSLGQLERARPLAAAALTVVEAAGAGQLALRASSAA